MKKRGILSGLLVICLMLSIIHVPVFGAEEDSEGLKQAITTAKNIIIVPEEYTDFTNDATERETVNGKVRVWRLNWQEKEAGKGYVSASVGEDGFLYDYDKYSSDQNQDNLGKVTKEQAQNAAEEFIAKAIPADSKQMKVIDSNSSREGYNFTYQKFVNESQVNFFIVSISVNKDTGEVTSYNGGKPELKGIEYPDLEGIISQSDGEKAYIQNIGVSLKYYSNYDYKQKKLNIFAGYSIDDNSDKSIDAKTGQVVVSNYKDDDIIGFKDYSGSSNKADVMDVKEGFTKEESDEIENVSDLITKEKAESILREASDIIPAQAKVNDSSLRKDMITNEYKWRISFDGAYGEVNAKSGEVISMQCYNNADNTSGKNISKAEAQNIAQSFLNKIAPDKYAQTKYKDEDKFVLYDKVSGNEANYSLNYVRQVNGIEFSSNSLRVEVSGADGKVIGYNNKWYEDISFPDISQAMSKENAFNKIKEYSGFSLQYTMEDKTKVGLVYNFKNKYINYIIDPISGMKLDYTGKAYKEDKLPEYTDINGQSCEKTVKALLDNGYYIDGDKFNPNMNITQINFFKYLYSPVKNSYDSDDEFYDMLIQSGVIKSEEKSPNSLVSNQDAAKFIVRYLGYDKLAQQPEIFANPYTDNIADSYKGYAAICYGLNIIKGTNGNFYGTRNITNAEAATIIYNLISVDTNKF